MRILTINSGSSSIKVALYEIGRAEELLLSGDLERIGLRSGVFKIRNERKELLVDEDIDLPDHQAALKRLFTWLEDYHSGQKLDAVGHRLVHGGPRHFRPQLITPEVIADLKECVPLAPDHLPHEIRAIQITSQTYPDLDQVACFDTAFHRSMPELAQIYPLPRYYQRTGLVRYGFHGLSYEYIMQELRKEAGDDAARGRVIIAHLGNGASMAAVWKGKSQDTTMGFTPAGGLVMSTRTGDLDPGVLVYLLEESGMRPPVVNNLINHEAGLLGVSGISSDMKDLLDQEKDQADARMAVDLFCYQARKHLGALSTVLGGVETLIFTGGIGENSPDIRHRICHNLAYMGIVLDRRRNNANAARISPDENPVTVRVMKTDEDLMIARHTYQLIKQPVK